MLGLLERTAPNPIARPANPATMSNKKINDLFIRLDLPATIMSQRFQASKLRANSALRKSNIEEARIRHSVNAGLRFPNRDPFRNTIPASYVPRQLSP